MTTPPSSKKTPNQPPPLFTTLSSRTSSSSDRTPSPVSSTTEINPIAEAALRRKVDLRLCTIAGLLASLDLLDSGLISSASVTTLFSDLDLGVANRYSISISIFTVASIAFQLPATLLVRYFGPRVWFSGITIGFGAVTVGTAFVTNWKQLIALRVLLGMFMAGVYPGLTYLISTWYTRREQQLRFAYLQSGEVFVLASGGLLNYGLNHLDGKRGLQGWRWMFLVQGVLAMALGIITYWWIIDFPENAAASFRFLKPEEAKLAVSRIEEDRKDVKITPFTWGHLFVHARDFKIYGFAAMFFLLNLVSTALSYFLPIILQGGMGFSTDQSILLAVPPYYWAIIPVLLSSWFGDAFRLRGPVIIFNSLCLIAGMAMLGFSEQAAVRYIGTFLATGAYISNWAALSAYYSNNIVGQWKRVFTAAVVTACNGAGGIAGSFIFRQQEAPGYTTAVWVAIGSHVIMILVVLLFSTGFYRANNRQAKGKKIIEGTPGFRHTY